MTPLVSDDHISNDLDHQDRTRQDFFNQRARGWLDNHYKDPDTGRFDLHRKKLKRMVDTLDLGPHDRVLDLGCGSGVLVPYILDRLSPRGHLTETDYAREMIEANRERHKDPRISFKCAHVMDMDFEPGSFDVVACFACFPHFQDQKGALARIARVLKPGGRLTIAHLMSSDEIAGHHHKAQAVARDILPPFETLAAWMEATDLTITSYGDEPGWYCLCAKKKEARE